MNNKYILFNNVWSYLFIKKRLEYKNWKKIN